MNPSNLYPFQPFNLSPGYHSNAPAYALQQPLGRWTTGLCDCCDDYPSCCLSCFCPCVAVGQISEILNGGTISCGYSGILYCCLWNLCLGWLYSCTNRSSLRELFALPQLPDSDYCLHCCCSPCAISQEYRELQNRGAHLSAGWEDNVEKWKQEGLMPPITVLGIVR